MFLQCAINNELVNLQEKEAEAVAQIDVESPTQNGGEVSSRKSQITLQSEVGF